MKYLIIIPARGGSKGIPGKNTVKINDIPLISYTIRAAQKALASTPNAELVISTDDTTIADVCRDEGVSVPFFRPAELAGDTTKSSEYVNHALWYFDTINNRPENIIILQPTSPLRTSEDITQSISLFEKHGANSLISAYREEFIYDKVIYEEDGLYGIPRNRNHNAGGRRQDEKPYLVRNGAIYIFSVSYFERTLQLVCDNPVIYLMPQVRSVNIDTSDDLDLARALLS